MYIIILMIVNGATGFNDCVFISISISPFLIFLSHNQFHLHWYFQYTIYDYIDVIKPIMNYIIYTLRLHVC